MGGRIGICRDLSHTTCRGTYNDCYDFNNRGKMKTIIESYFESLLQATIPPFHNVQHTKVKFAGPLQNIPSGWMALQQNLQHILYQSRAGIYENKIRFFSIIQTFELLQRVTGNIRKNIFIEFSMIYKRKHMARSQLLKNMRMRERCPYLWQKNLFLLLRDGNLEI